MKCRFCGTKIGVFERWRYGDFCTEEHRTEFAEDLNRLNAQIVKDLRRIPVLMKPPEPEVESDPPEAPLVAEPAPAPVTMARVKESRQETLAAKTRNGEWRMLAQIAEWDQLPVAALAASRKRQSRFILLGDGNAPEAGPGDSLTTAQFAVFLPSPEAVSGGGWPAPGGAPAWIDDQGWRWVSESAPAAAPRMDTVLTQMPLRAPWLNWEFVAPGHGAGRGLRGMSPGYGVLPFMGEPYPALAQPVPGGCVPPGPMQASPAWLLLAPPLFNALVDVAFGLAVQWSGAECPSHAADLWTELERHLPQMHQAPQCSVHLVDCQDDLSSEERAADHNGAMRRPLLNTLWRRQLNIPAALGTIGRPQVPRQAVREMRLSIGAAPELPPARAEAFARRRAY
ncbi:MAG: hypothetical protein HZB13_01690 [Acidobacteria bacterium]|nr:hypothetical protein [Acidobacteriota bacterium]